MTYGYFCLCIITYILLSILVGELIHYFRCKNFIKKNPHLQYKNFIFRTDSYCSGYIVVFILLFLFAFFERMINQFDIPI